MTDTNVGQLALITPVQSIADGHVAQIAMISVVNEAPPQAAGAKVGQIAIISVDKEYVIPKHLHGWLIPCIWGNPFFIERGQFL